MIYRRELDGLRAIAITLVVIMHAYKEQFLGGWIGVDIFFVLSGYLITRILTAELDATGAIALPRFYLRRFLRLAPALALLLAAVAYMEFSVLGRRSSETGWPILMAGSYMMNWNRAFEWGAIGSLGHSWSLAIEEQFYLLWPIVLIWVPRALRLKATLALIGAIFCWRAGLLSAGASTGRVFNGFDTHADSLLVGCALAQISIHRSHAHRLQRLWPIPIAAIAVLAVVMTYDSPAAMAFGIPLAALLGAWLIVAAGEPGPLNWVLSLGPPVFVGRISYGIYLWHDPMLIYLRHLFPPLLAIVPVLLGVLFAAASFYFMERKILLVRDRPARAKTASLVAANGVIDAPQAAITPPRAGPSFSA